MNEFWSFKKPGGTKLRKSSREPPGREPCSASQRQPVVPRTSWKLPRNKEG